MKDRNSTPITIYIFRLSSYHRNAVRKILYDCKRSSLGIYSKPASPEHAVRDREGDVAAMSRSSPPSPVPERSPDTLRSPLATVTLPQASSPSPVPERSPIALKSPGATVRLPQASPPSQVSANLLTSTYKKTTPAFLAQCSAHEELSGFIMEARNLNCLRTAPLNPPITEAGLSELDRSSIFSCLRLRHDLNFNADLIFNRGTDGAIDAHRMTEAQAYWDALGIELTMYVAHWQALSSDSIAMPTTMGSSFELSQDVPLRLPRMLETICKITKSLVPPSMWDAIDARFDIDLLMQELRHGACDVAGLGSWLGTTLKQSRSHRQDHPIESMISTIQRGTETQNAQLLLLGLKDLSSLLENMKQDMANAEIRVWRNISLEDFVAFEQQEIVRYGPGGWESLRWLPWESQEQDQAAVPTLSAFSMAFTDLIALNTIELPLSFAHDHSRIRFLQSDFHFLIYQSVCRHTFQRLLRLQRWAGVVPQASYDRLFYHVFVIVTASDLTHDALRRRESVALEIARETYYVSNRTGLPDQELLDATVAMLGEAYDFTSQTYEDLKQDLSSRLKDLVEEEIQVIDRFTPVQMANRYAPQTDRFASQGSRSTNISEKSRLKIVAGRIAHIVVLHRMVWGPIVYQRPSTTRANITTS